MESLVTLLVLSVLSTGLYEVKEKPWFGVFAWISWWLLSLQWMSEGAWHLSLLPFAIGLLYFLRVLLSAVKPHTVKKFIARMEGV